jgi:hypothetical protein
MSNEKRAPTPRSSPKTTSDSYQVGSEGRSAFSEAPAPAREKARRDPALWLPGGSELDQDPTRPELETRYSVDARRLKGTPQVGVRLRQTDFHRLCRAAEIYGVRPTTMARMMILRGVKAILDAELRDKGVG